MRFAQSGLGPKEFCQREAGFDTYREAVEASRFRALAKKAQVMPGYIALLETAARRTRPCRCSGASRRPWACRW
jgi:hypothetical protein